MRYASLVPTLAAIAAALTFPTLFAAESTTPAVAPTSTPSTPTPTATAPHIVVTGPEAQAPDVPSTDTMHLELGEVPGGTSLIPAEVLREGRTTTLRDALQTVPGIYVQPRFGSEESRISIRGSGISRTFHQRGIMLMQDGQPINVADGSGDMQAIDPGLCEYVSVYRGANALEFGSANLGGAINFVSPTGYTADAMRLRAEGGSFGYLKASGDGGFVHDTIDGWIGVSGYTSEGFRDHSAQENIRALGNLGYQFNDTITNRVYLSYVDSDSELPGSLTKAEMEDDPTQAGNGADNRDTKRDYPLIRVADRVTFAWDDVEAQLGLGYMDKELFHPLTFGIIDQDSQDWSADAHIVDSRAELFGLPTKATFGIIGQQGVTEAQTYAYDNATGQEAGNLTSAATQTATNMTAYGEIQQTISDNWVMILGAQAVSVTLKFDDTFLSNGNQSSEETWTALNPKLGARWQVTDSIIGFTNISRSFEPPTFSEYVQIQPGFINEPVDIDAQSAWTFEIGSRGSVDRVSWDVAFYHARIDGEYLSYTIAPGISNYVNADTTEHTGLEFGLDLLLAEHMLTTSDSLTLNQVYNWGYFHFVDDDVYGDNTLPGIPANVWRGDLRYAIEHWYASIIGEFQSSWAVDYNDSFDADSSFLIGARIGYHENTWSAFIEGRNLADTTYAATTGIANPASATPIANQQLFNPGDGRAVYLGVEWAY